MTPIMRQILLSNKLLVRDDFNRVDSINDLGMAQSGQIWTSIQGTWGISGNAAYNPSATLGDTIKIDAKSLNYRGSVEIFNANMFIQYNGLFLRYVDANNYLRVRNENTILKVIKRITGTSTEVGSYDIGGDAGNRNWKLGFCLNGQLVQIIYNNSVVIEYVLSVAEMAATNSTSMCLTVGGIPANTTRWDNLTVRRR